MRSDAGQVRIDVFSTKPYDREFLTRAAEGAEPPLELVFHDARLGPSTAMLANGATAVCAFVNDDLSAPVLDLLADMGIGLVAMRSAGVNNVDLPRARELGLKVARVPAYSPHAVAEHAVALILALNRKIHRAYNRVREGNFALDGLMGFDLHGKTAGVVGTGVIGQVLARILLGFGCKVVASDPYPDEGLQAAGVTYLPFEDLLGQSDVITLQCPLTPETRHLIDARAVAAMKPGAMLINTSRGAVVDTDAVIAGLKSGQIGALGLDVYEEESDLFFEDLSNRIIPDDHFARLQTFPNVLITGHQGFFTREALTAIARTTVENITSFARDGTPANRVE